MARQGGSGLATLVVLALGFGAGQVAPPVLPFARGGQSPAGAPAGEAAPVALPTPPPLPAYLSDEERRFLKRASARLRR